ncbi:MAG: cyclase family protein [Cyanobacteria bacterium HKST-UBA02]|nr:cyclase family protein [Cyanobacteria bacterium HKST-UBA02]
MNETRPGPDRPFTIIDISQPVNSRTACFPGDTPFQRAVTLTVRDSGVVNLTAMTMSPHVGTHADAPVHIEGDLEEGRGVIGSLSLEPFLGPVRIVDLAPFSGGIEPEHYQESLDSGEKVSRVLFRTCHRIRYEVFESEYAYISIAAAEDLVSRGIVLVGLDTPSVDHIDSKSLESHHVLNRGGMVWLENLDLTSVTAGDYYLVALPLKLEELEASPVRAVLLAEEKK